MFYWETLWAKEKPSPYQCLLLFPVQALNLLSNSFSQNVANILDSSSRLGPPLIAFQIESEMKVLDLSQNKNSIICPIGREGFFI